jgi:predicted O-methyltransferase YrrM
MRAKAGEAVQAVRRAVSEARTEPRARFDAKRLSRQRPSLVPAPWRPAESDLLPAYTEYVNGVSVADHAASLETCAFLAHLCAANRPKRLLDTGSGFSSYVLRRYAAEAGAAVVSVDDSAEWLPRTKEFLERSGLDTTDVLSWEEFRARDWEPFDLIFHDLAGGALREEAMPLVTSLLAPDGVIVYDDAHHSSHRAAMYRNASDLETYSLKRWTRDRFGRWAILAVR